MIKKTVQDEQTMLHFSVK